MELETRKVDIDICLHPTGTQYLGISMTIGREEISWNASSAMGEQFGAFLSALYSLYTEGYDCHNEPKQSAMCDEQHRIYALTASVDWDAEGDVLTMNMVRRLEEEEILLRVTTDYGATWREFTVNGRDLCYAAAKACTDVLKRYGFYGYRSSTEGDGLLLYQLLFIKAYALGAMDARRLTPAADNDYARASDFEKEMELLLFDM